MSRRRGPTRGPRRRRSGTHEVRSTPAAGTSGLHRADVGPAGDRVAGSSRRRPSTRPPRRSGCRGWGGGWVPCTRSARRRSQRTHPSAGLVEGSCLPDLSSQGRSWSCRSELLLPRFCGGDPNRGATFPANAGVNQHRNRSAAARRNTTCHSLRHTTTRTCNNCTDRRTRWANTGPPSRVRPRNLGCTEVPYRSHRSVRGRLPPALSGPTSRWRRRVSIVLRRSRAAKR